MISIISVLLLISFVLLIVVLSAKKLRSYDSRYLFQDYEKTNLPYIKLNVQGQYLNMLVDTCCAMSIISKDALNGLEYKKSKRKVSLQALVSDDALLNVIKIPFTINDRQFEEEFAVYDTEDIAGFEEKHDITIHGVLGSEFFNNTKCHIDYNNHSITFP